MKFRFTSAKSLIAIGMCALAFAFGAQRTISVAKDAPTATKPAGAAPKSAQKKEARTPSGKKATAKELLADANKASAFMIKSARADKALDGKVAKNKPFWQATQKISKALDRAEKGFAAKSDDFFQGVSDARTAEEQMKVAWQLTDSKNKQVIDSGKKLGHALALLRTDFSKEAARKKKGGELTAQEKQAFEKIKAQQKALLAKIAALEAKAKDDKALLHGLHKMKQRAARIVKAPLTVNAFVATLYVVDEIEGLLYGYDYYVDKRYRGDWFDVAVLTTEWETTYTEIYALETYEWSAVETSVDIYAGEEVETSETMTTEEVASEESYAETESFAMSDAEEEEVAVEENTDAEIDSDDSAADDSMDDASDDDGSDFDGDGDDDSSDDDGGADDDGGGGDDGGGDDGGGDDGGGDDGGGDDGGGDDGGGDDDGGE